MKLQYTLIKGFIVLYLLVVNNVFIVLNVVLMCVALMA